MKSRIVLLIISLSTCCSIFAANVRDDSKSIKLSNSEIDLLVGTPEGISEPLDSRRNTITKENKVDYSCFFDDNALTEDSQSNFIWEDAEDNVPNENQVENQLLDLLAETEELEKTDQILYHNEYDDDQASASIMLNDYQD